MEKFARLISVAPFFLLLCLPFSLAGHDYGQALSKSILFFEAQRSGYLPHDQRVTWRSNSGLNDGKASGVDLVGGYYDAGDNVKFGLPMAFTVTMMSWSIIEYGKQLGSSGELGHAMNAVKWGSDYLIKAHPQPDVLYGEVGDGNTDHYCWQRPEDMTTDRRAYKIDPSNPGSDLAGETAAAMAAASIVFRRSNPSYANELLAHARQLFNFADKYRGKYDSSFPFFIALLLKQMVAPLLRSLWSTTRKPFSPRATLIPRFFSTASASTATTAAPNPSLDPSRLRNVAVIAHVDHGKTTLMDRLLRQCGADIPHERAMDSINLERERGITISSKVTSISWKDNELNMVDTPGHADFGGEVERVVGMVEGAILVVDAGEGPLAQTKFVLAKALKYGIRPILLLNKVDRPAVSEERCDEVESLVFDLFANLGATEEQLDFPVLYASAKEGWASSSFTKDPPTDMKNMSQLLDAIIRHVPPPNASLDAPFQMLVSMMEKDFYLGRILTGRVFSGAVRVGDRIHGLRSTDSGVTKIEEGKITKLMKKKGTSMALIDSAGAGDIISMAGMTTPVIGNTVANVEVMTALPTVELDPPTISMTFGVNDSPLAGRDGTHLTGGKIGDRLMAEAETNLAINVLPGIGESFEVQGRGELQLGILIENMRREGFELSVSPPRVMYKTENKEKLEPIEEVTIEVNEEHVGLIMEALSHRRAEVLDMGPVPGHVGRTRLSLTCPSRGLVGYRSVFSSDTRGTGFMHRAFLTYAKHRGPLGNVRKGVLVSMGYGTITAYALMSLEPRGILFVNPGMETYDGMIVGEHSRDTDLDINPVRAKELSNMRSANKDENVKLSPPRLMTLEEAIGYVASDELIEVTPKAIRLRKRYLEVNKRKSMSKRLKE